MDYRWVIEIETILEKDLAAYRQEVGKPGIQVDAQLAVVTVYKNKVKRLIPVLYCFMAINLD